MRRSRNPNESVYGELRAGNRRSFPWPFDPIQERSLSLWLRAGDEMYTDDGTTLVTSDGDAVQQWRNKLNTAQRWRQTSAGSKPTYKTNIQNGHPILRFDGGDFLDHNNSDHFFGGNENFFICVCTPNTGSQDYIWSGNNGNGGPSFLSNFSSKAFEYFTHGSGERDTFATSASGFHILTVVRPEGAGQHQLYYDGLRLLPPGTNVNTTDGNWSGKILSRIGRYVNGVSGGITADIGEMMQGTRALPVDRINDFHAYLGLYWSIPVVMA